MRMRSVAAVLAGLLVTVTVVVFGTFLATLALGGPEGAVTPPYLALNLAVSLGAAVLGGWAAGRLAPSRPLAHGGAFALLLALLAVPALASPTPGQPVWYAWVVLLLGPLGALGGAALVARSGAVRSSPERDA